MVKDKEALELMMSKVSLIENKLKIVISQREKARMKRLDEEYDRLSRYQLSEDSFIIKTMLLAESRGRLDGTDGMVDAIYNYVKKIIQTNEILLYRKSYKRKLHATMYSFDVPASVLKGVNTLFMYKPMFTINIYKSDNLYPDLDMYMDPTAYSVPKQAHIENVGGHEMLLYPRFEISVLANNEWYFPKDMLAGAMNHEFTHAKINFEEYKNGSNPLSDTKYTNIKRFSRIRAKNQAEKILKRWFYLSNKDEINARANQLYDELERLDTKFNTGGNIKKLIPMCQSYRNTKDEIEEILQVLAANIDNTDLENAFTKRVRGYGVITIRDMWYKLHNAWIQQEKQFTKVAEYWLMKSGQVKV